MFVQIHTCKRVCDFCVYVCVCVCVCVCVLAPVEGQMLPTLQAYCFTAFCGNVAVPTLALIRSQSHAWAHGGAELMHTHRHTRIHTPAGRHTHTQKRMHGNSVMRDKGNKWKMCVSVVILFIKVQGTVCACNQRETLRTHTHTHTHINKKDCLKRH